MRMRQGDFGQLLPNTLIYDPLTTVAESRVTERFLFVRRSPNNIIPSDRFDPIAYTMINAYPTPTSSSLRNNYALPRIQPQNYDQGDVRVDEQITAKDSDVRALVDPGHNHHFTQHLCAIHDSRDHPRR